MPNEDPLPNMTAQERKDWAQAKVTNRAAADRAPHNSDGRGSVRDVIDTQQRADRDRATEGGRERERTR